MTAEHYIQEKDRLSQAMNGQDRLMEAVGDITKTLADTTWTECLRRLLM